MMDENRAHQVICPAELVSGAQYSHTNLYLQNDFPSFNFLLLYEYLSHSAYVRFISLLLSFPVVIFTECLVKGTACPQVWIRFTHGLERECLAKLLCSAVIIYMRWRGRGNLLLL